MLKSFCAAANLKALLLRGSDIPAVKQCAEEVDRTSELFAPDRNFPEAAAALERRTNTRRDVIQQLHPDVFAALHSQEAQWKSRISGWTTPRQAIRLSRRSIGGFEFTTYTESRALGSIFFEAGDSERQVPGRIQDIFAVEMEREGLGRHELFCVVKRHLGQPRPIPCSDQMLPVFEEFGAYLWSSGLSEQVEIIPFDQTLCHMIGRQWSEGLVVLRPLNRVSKLIE